MSLQAKFAILLGSIGLTVVLALAASMWALNFMHNESRRPFEVMSSALIELQTLKFAVEKQREQLLSGPTEPTASGEVTQTPRELFEAEGKQISAAMQTLVANEAIVNVTGKTSLANLRTRISDSRDLSEMWFATANPQDLAAATESLGNAFSLIRRIESRIIGDTNGLVTHAIDIRARLQWLTGIVVFVISLFCTLGLLLVRRWVVGPVAELRTAAARIAAGDFLHRIPVRGGDELGALSTEVNAMAAMVKAMQDEAVQRERLAAVGEVVQRIAHNLRSPLAGIRGLAELTRNELDSPAVSNELRDDIGENQRRIIGAVDRFELWLRDLLSATRPLDVVPRTMDPREWLERVVDAYRPKAQANRIELELETTDAPRNAAFDPRHLEQAVGALIANAMDAVSAAPTTGQPAKVRITCRSLAQESGQTGQLWELRVQDNGPGVPPDLRDRIFAPYFTTKREGTGIGLALAMQVIRAHGGALTLLDVPHDGGTMGGAAPNDRGAVFSAWMPIGPIEAGLSGVAAAGHSELFSGQNSRH